LFKIRKEALMGNIEKEMPVRLENIMSWAKEGKEVKADVVLTKQQIIQKALVEASGAEEIAAYLLTGDFTFQVDGKSYEVSKTYLRGYASESFDVSAANRSIANARLKVDYQRLMQAGIKLEEKYFETLRF